MRRFPGTILEIERIATARAKVIAPRSMNAAIEMLDEIHYGTGIHELFIVGGDGTFNLVLNWVMRLPDHRRPDLIPVGGGEINYMTRYVGLTVNDPIVNLETILSDTSLISRIVWSPLVITERNSGRIWYAAVFSTGIVERFIAWYEDTGKGNMVRVFGMIAMAILSVLSDSVRKWLGRLEGTNGQLTIQDRRIVSGTYTGLVASTVPVMIPLCWPFSGSLNGRTFYLVAYWGSLRQLIPALPWVWIGKNAPFARHLFFNEPVDSISIKTSDSRIILDGDRASLPPALCSEQEFRFHMEVSLGPAVNLLGRRS